MTAGKGEWIKETGLYKARCGVIVHVYEIGSFAYGHYNDRCRVVEDMWNLDGAHEETGEHPLDLLERIDQ
jgi:hypothetical protein